MLFLDEIEGILSEMSSDFEEEEEKGEEDENESFKSKIIELEFGNCENEENELILDHIYFVELYHNKDIYEYIASYCDRLSQRNYEETELKQWLWEEYGYLSIPDKGLAVFDYLREQHEHDYIVNEGKNRIKELEKQDCDGFNKYSSLMALYKCIRLCKTDYTNLSTEFAENYNSLIQTKRELMKLRFAMGKIYHHN